LEDTIYKCRFIYFEDVISVEFQSYSIKKINTLSLSICDEFDYHYKFLNRESFEKLKGLKHIADDIIIVKDNIITDCSYANLVFFNGQEWITPKNPLLLGTKRQKYLDEKKIVEQIITPSELKFFSNLRLINAMIDLEESPDIPIENIL
jgi:4-amino-4-deoxychorismate lyase